MGKKWEPLRIGQSLTILVAERGGINEYTTKVQDVSDQWVTVSAPTQRQRVVDAPAGTELSLLLNEGGKLKSFVSRLERTRLGQVPLWILSRPVAEVTEVQRRGFYRLETFLRVQYAVVGSKSAQADEYAEEAVVVNLSGGGLGFHSDRQLPDAALLKLRLSLDGQTIILAGKVVRQELLLQSARPRYLIGIQFVDITTQQQDILIKYIFKEQLRLRAKGLM